MSDLFDKVKDITAIVGAGAALLAIWKGYLEFSHHAKLKRAEQFIEMRNRLHGDQTYQKIIGLIHGADPKLRDVTKAEKHRVLATFEDIALMMDSGIIKPDVAYYMFGAGAIGVWRSDDFWNDTDRNDKWWSLFKDFPNEMERIDKHFVFERERMKF
jgi:hypothetical protein